MDRYQQLSAVIGLCTMALGTGLLLVPGVGTTGPVEALQESITDSGTERVLLLAGVVVIGYLAIGLRRSSETLTQSPERRRFERATAATASGESVNQPVAGELDVEAAVQSGAGSQQRVRVELRRTAIGVYTDLYGASEQAATRAVDRGEWCHDPVASAFLAGDSGPSFSLGRQLRLFLTPKRERRHRIERTITAIEELQDR